jgi:CBS domain containing-hemolysin-like protein
MEKIMTLPQALLLLVLMILAFFFSATETSIIGLSRIKLRHMLSKGIKRAQRLQRLISNLDKFIVAILVGNNVVNIAISAIVTAISVRVFGFHWGVVISTFLTSLFILIFCEITPKLLAIKHTERFALFTAPLMDIFIKVFRPIIAIFTAINNFILKMLGIKYSKKSPLITEEELRLMIELGREEGFLSDEEKKMLLRIFEFGDIMVKDVMVPREKMVAVNINTNSEELLNIFVEQGHARLPVFRDSLETVVGIVYARDLLYILRDKGLFLLQDLVHEAYFVDPAAKVNELLKTFQADKIQIAVVADKNKKTLGMVTLEDLIEELVGELEEKHTGRRPAKK